MSSKVRNSKRNNTDMKKKDSKKQLETTTRIRIDLERLEDTESLDTSFLEGRLKKDFYLNKRKTRRERFILKEISSKAVIFTIVVLLVFGMIVFLFPYLKFEGSHAVNDKKVKKEEITVSEKKIDDNYLFVGDFYTEDLNLEEVTFPHVKSSNKDYDTTDILNDMKKMIYQYNPSVVFLEIGMNDLKDGESEEDIVERIGKIIEEINNNRPYADIYVESIYPINVDIDDYDEDILDDSVTIEKISSLNKKIKDVVKEKKVHYIDVYNELVQDGKLKEKYTDNGVYLNEQGYDRVLKIIKEVIEG